MVGGPLSKVKTQERDYSGQRFPSISLPYLELSVIISHSFLFLFLVVTFPCVPFYFSHSIFNSLTTFLLLFLPCFGTASLTECFEDSQATSGHPFEASVLRLCGDLKAIRITHRAIGHYPSRWDKLLRFGLRNFKSLALRDEPFGSLSFSWRLSE